MGGMQAAEEDGEEPPPVLAMPRDAGSESLPLAQVLETLPLAAAPVLEDAEDNPLQQPGGTEPRALTEREAAYSERVNELLASTEQQMLHVMPACAPYTEALGELAAEDARKLSVTIDESLTRRQQYVSRVLDQHGVDGAQRDPRNLLTGITDVKRDAKQDRWKYGVCVFTSLAEALAAADVLRRDEDS